MDVVGSSHVILVPLAETSGIAPIPLDSGPGNDHLGNVSRETSLEERV
jgi:hypothetical protein